MQSGVMLSVGHVLRYDPVIHKIKVNSFCHTLCFLHQARVRALGLKISVWVLVKELIQISNKLTASAVSRSADHPTNKALQFV